MRRIVIMLVAALVVAGSATAAALHSASGSGHIVFGTNQEFITFNAQQTSADGTATGTATVHDVSAGVTAKIDVNCLNVIGNIATISGIVTKSSNPTLEGFQGIFQVVDNGEGNDSPPDLMSLANFYTVGVGPDCRVPAEYNPVPLQSGNVQVR